MKNIGSVIGLYPTPVTVVGTELEGKVNWLNVAHIGVVGLDGLMISINKKQYSNTAMQKNKTLSINLVNENILKATDYVGIVSAHKVDKSTVFEYFMGETKHAPLIKNAPVAMACIVDHIYDSGTHLNYMLKVSETHVQEEFLDEKGKIDYEKIKPILFEFQTNKYLETGKSVAKAWNIGKNYK